MGTYDLWDDIETSYTDRRQESPFWKLPYKEKDADSEKKVHEWLIQEMEFLKYVNKPRFNRIRKNLALLKGVQYRDREIQERTRQYDSPRARGVERLVLNYLYDLTKSRTSKFLKYKPGISILPTSDEQNDKISAKMTKAWLDHIWYVERFDGVVLPQFVRVCQPCGEAYLFTDWDPEKGDISKQYMEAKKAAEARGERIEEQPLLDEDGNPEKDDSGKEIKIESPVRNGDVVYYVKMPTDVMVERVAPGQGYDDAKYMLVREIMDVDLARLKYPRGAKNIESDDTHEFFDYNRLESYKDKRKVEMWTFYYKRSREMEKGRKVVFTRKGIVASTDFPFSHSGFPCVRLTDIDVPGEQDGMSFFEIVKGPTGVYNNLTNMIVRNLAMVSHPKWMMPAGSAKVDSLGNAITIVEYKGPVAPQLVTAGSVPADLFNFRSTLKEEFMQHADVGMTGRGDPPPGVTAAVAMQYLSELENERWNEGILKYNESILQNAIMSISVGGDYYDESDERMVRLLGKNNAWMTMAFSGAHLHKDYDVRIQSSSALPESKAAKTEYLLYLNERFPEKVDADSVLNMLELAQSEKFINAATISVRAAEAENEMLTDPDKHKTVKAPTEEEDHIVHWMTHARAIREFAYKYQTPAPLQEALKDHLLATEMLIVEKAMTNPDFKARAQKIAAEGFPLIFKIPPAPEAPPAPEMPPQGGVPYNMPPQGGEMPPEEQLGSQPEGAPVNVEPQSVATQLEGQLPPNIEPTRQI